ncbi:hypothetical protein WA588_006360 [Blastocystis sp. NMH]
MAPTSQPTTETPTIQPTIPPTIPSTLTPSMVPTEMNPTEVPTPTADPTLIPTMDVIPTDPSPFEPTDFPQPTDQPTLEPTTESPLDVVVIPASLLPDPLADTQLVVTQNTYNDNNYTRFILRRPPSLKSIVVEGNCFTRARYFEINGLNALESVTIKRGSFTYALYSASVMKNNRTDGSFSIINCPQLKSISIADNTFSDYARSFTIKDLPSLLYFETGLDSFYRVLLFSLKDLPQLQSTRIGQSAFELCQRVVFENLPQLQSIVFVSWALRGDRNNYRKTISSAPYNYDSSLTMKNLPLLTRVSGSNNFDFIGSVILENIPLLSTGNISFSGSFQYTYSLQSSSTLFSDR